MRRLALLVLALLAAAACGEGDSPSIDVPTSTTTTTEASAPSGGADRTALPLGDSHVNREAPAVGDLYLCAEFPTDGGGAQVDGDWINGDTWDATAKVIVSGDVAWPDARFTATVDGDERVLSGNLLPVDHHTGTFPVAADDPAAAVDPNPNSIVANDYEIRVPANPTAATEPGCVGGEVGFALSGIVVNSAVDAMGRDAVAHEVQDRCDGHPNNAGYHYHAVSSCITDEGAGHSALVGYALDGFGIYGLRGEDGSVLSDADLDECHGHEHEITWDGEQATMFHYHATYDFPYVVGCFHGTNSFRGPVLGAPHEP